MRKIVFLNLTNQSWYVKMSNVKENVESFCNHTSIHGFAYFFENISFLERLFWVSITFIMISFGVVIIDREIKNWNENPTSLSRSSELVSVKTIQFPTVTVCTGTVSPNCL